jgi:hypothetical protein
MKVVSVRNLKKVDCKVKHGVEVSGLELWKIWKLRWKIIALGKRSENIQQFQPKGA